MYGTTFADVSRCTATLMMFTGRTTFADVWRCLATLEQRFPSSLVGRCFEAFCDVYGRLQLRGDVCPRFTTSEGRRIVWRRAPTCGNVWRRASTFRVHVAVVRRSGFTLGKVPVALLCTLVATSVDVSRSWAGLRIVR